MDPWGARLVGSHLPFHLLKTKVNLDESIASVGFSLLICKIGRSG